jgi:fructokinase
MRRDLLPRVRRHLRDLMNGYLAAELTEDLDGYVVGPRLGERAGVLGALALALAQSGAPDGDGGRGE